MRSTRGVTVTDYRYTGQRAEQEIGLLFYQARWMDPILGRFTQADTIIPDPGNPLSLDRYAYGYSNPVKYIDPSGHDPRFVMIDGIYGGVPEWEPPPTPPPDDPFGDIVEAAVEGDDIADDLSPLPATPECQGLECVVGESKPDHQPTPSNPKRSGNDGSTCYGASVAGGLGLAALFVFDIGLVVANIAVLQVPGVGPIVEVLILAPTDLIVAYLHIPFAELVVQGATRPCNELNIKIFPPFDFE